MTLVGKVWRPILRKLAISHPSPCSGLFFIAASWRGSIVGHQRFDFDLLLQQPGWTHAFNIDLICTRCFNNHPFLTSGIQTNKKSNELENISSRSPPSNCFVARRHDRHVILVSTSIADEQLGVTWTTDQLLRHHAFQTCNAFLIPWPTSVLDFPSDFHHNWYQSSPPVGERPDKV